MINFARKIVSIERARGETKKKNGRPQRGHRILFPRLYGAKQTNAAVKQK
jgi:hypothetical protein